MSRPSYNDFCTSFRPEVAGVEIQGTTLLADAACDWFGVDRYSGIIVFVNVGTVGGTSPTLTVRLRTIMPDGASDAEKGDGTKIELAASASITATGKYGFGFVSSGNDVFTDASLAAGTFLNIPLGMCCDLLLDVGGTSPSFVITSLEVILVR